MMLHLLSVVLNFASPATEQHKEPPLGDEDKAAGDLEHSCSPEIPQQTQGGTGTILPGGGKTSGLSTAVPGLVLPLLSHGSSARAEAQKAQKEDEQEQE